MPCCVAFGCNSNSSTDKSTGSGIKFHRFPHSKQTLLRSWIAAVRRKHWTPTKSSRICCKHFTEDDYLPGYVNRKQLKDDAVPSVFSFPAHFHRPVFKRKTFNSLRTSAGMHSSFSSESNTTSASSTIVKRRSLPTSSSLYCDTGANMQGTSGGSANTTLSLCNSSFLSESNTTSTSSTVVKRRSLPTSSSLYCDTGANMQGTSGGSANTTLSICNIKDHTYAVKQSPATLKRWLMLTEDNLRQAKRDRSNAVKREKRAKASLQTYAAELKKLKLLTDLRQSNTKLILFKNQ